MATPSRSWPPTADIAADAGPLAVLFSHWRVILLGLGLIAAGTISTYVFSFMTTYAQTTLHMGLQTGLLVAVTNGVAGFFRLARRRRALGPFWPAHPVDLAEAAFPGGDPADPSCWW
ncbi:MAG: hypothetical protein WDM85_03410 [Caulobacteraceae bacterium]